MKNSTLKWLYEVTGKKKAGIMLLLLVQMVLGLMSVFYALFLRNIIDAAVEKDRLEFFTGMAMLVGLVVLQIALRAVVRWLEELSRSSVENILKNRLFSTLLKKDYASVTAVHSGEWLNRLTSDTVVCAGGVTEILPGIAGMLVKMAGALVMILALEPGFAYVLIPGGAALVLLTYAFRKVLKRLHKKIQEQDGKLRVFLQEHLGSLLVVRSFTVEKQVEEEAEKKMEEHKNARMKKNRFSNLCNIGFSGAMNGMYLFGLGYCGYGILEGTVSYGTLTAILRLVSQIQSPFANITGYLPRFYAMTASAERLMEAELMKDDCPDGVIEASEIHRFYRDEFAAIGFKNADFTYLRSVDGKEIPLVLQDINLQIRRGEYIAFTGQSGCGKSTLLKLLMCLYPLDGGKRYLLKKDNEMQELTSAWHRLFAYVPQGNQLMSGTVREIVAFSDKGKMQQEDKIRRSLEIACADEFVKNLENDMDTLLGERGSGLSEGQMQRIAIARAIFSDNPVLLLDESTSALDEQTEKKLLENLRSMTNKTVLIVTHRPAVLDICDRVVVMNETGIEVRG